MLNTYNQRQYLQLYNLTEVGISIFQTFQGIVSEPGTSVYSTPVRVAHGLAIIGQSQHFIPTLLSNFILLLMPSIRLRPYLKFRQTTALVLAKVMLEQN